MAYQRHERQQAIEKKDESDKERGNEENQRQLKIAYTNIDGLTARKLELNDYLNKEEPDIVCLAETKLTEAVNINLVGSVKYNTWRKDRKEKAEKEL